MRAVALRQKRAFAVDAFLRVVAIATVRHRPGNPRHAGRGRELPAAATVRTRLTTAARVITGGARVAAIRRLPARPGRLICLATV
jgi:hypothetical protein